MTFSLQKHLDGKYSPFPETSNAASALTVNVSEPMVSGLVYWESIRAACLSA